MTELQIHVVGYADSDAAEQAELAWKLQEEMRAGGIDDVERPSGTAPSGAKGSAIEWAELIVTLVGSLPPVIGVVRGWLDRHPGASITVKIDDDELTLSDASPSERRELIDAWMKRHGG